MTNKKTTKRALLSSILSLVLCLTMLIGTTFAWFTDSVTSANNQIVAGNLDVDVYYGDPANKNSIANVNTLFDDVTLWEPGAVAWENLTVVNLGTLALKYQMAINFSNENTVNDCGLSDVLKVGFVEGGITNAAAGREAVISGITDWQPMASFAEYGELINKNDSTTYGMVIYWEPTAEDNNWNVNNGKTTSDGEKNLHIDLGVKLVATQYTSEEDSFDKYYDGAAPWLGDSDTDWYFANPAASEFTIRSAEELAGLADIVNGEAERPASTFSLRSSSKVQDSFKGKTIYLASDIDLNEVEWTPIGNDEDHVFLGNFDGQEHTVYNLKVDTYGWAGLIGHAGKSAGVTIKNVNVEGVTINANRLAGSVVGQLYGSIDNCHVSHVVIKAVPNAIENGYDNGDKVGGVVGWLGDNNNNRSITNCSATDVQLTAYRDVGGIVGYVAWSTTLTGNSAKNVTITVDQNTNYYGDKDFNAGAIWGRHSVSDSGVGITESNSTETEIAITSKYSKEGIQYIKDGVTGETALYLVPADYAKDTVEVADGVTTIGGYAFAYNDNVETIILPSSVTTLNDRAFRDTSASTVVLNEGLTNISYQAFRNASNVESVVIPSTVTTISKEAFQNSGVKTLTIPANVTTIEYGGLRDMKELETVTIEGNVEIPVYAFRACTKLRTVILKGDDVTFAGRGMIFTNKENGDGSAITVYVANETVKERLLAADTAAKDYGGYKIVVGEPTVTENVDTLKDALNAGENVVITDDIEMEATTTAPYGNKVGLIQNGGIFDGGGNTLSVECYGDDYGIMTSGGTIKNLTIDSGCRAIVIMSPTEDIIIDNVYASGDILYPINTGEHATVSGVDLIVTNSTFGGWSSFAGVDSASFTGCNFINGSYGYGWPYDALVKPYINTTFTKCTFEINEDGDGYYLDLSSLGADCKVTLDQCTANGKVITAENCTTLFGEVELPSGRTIADCIIFK